MDLPTSGSTEWLPKHVAMTNSLLRWAILAGSAGAYLLLALTESAVHADDVGVTIQTSISNAYRATAPLGGGTQAQLAAIEDTDDPDKIAAALKKLEDGDMLVLAVHSNPTVFGLGTTSVAWENFWTRFGIKRPPNLAAVVIGGCMASKEKKNGEDVWRPISATELERLRSHMNTKALFTPKGIASTHLITIDTYSILKALYDGTQLNKIDLGGRWHLGVESIVDRDSATLETLRGSARPGPVLLGDLRDEGMRGRFRRGELQPFTGTAYQEHAPGQRKWEAEFVNGFPEGRWTEWHGNGQKSREYFLQDGKKHGVVTLWFPSGKVRATEEWRDGKMNGPSNGWFENGHHAWKISMSDGRRDGPYLKYHDNGQVSESGYYTGGQKSGEWITYDRDGQVLKRRTH